MPYGYTQKQWDAFPQAKKNRIKDEQSATSLGDYSNDTASGTGKTFIGGVPSSFVSARTLHDAPSSFFQSGTVTKNLQIPPQYDTGKDWSEMMRLASSGELAGLQRRLIEFDILDPDETWLGHPDDATKDMINAAMGLANMNGISWQEALEVLLSQEDAKAATKAARGGGGGGGGGSLLPNPEDVKALLNNTSKAMIGKSLSPAELDAGVNAFYSSYRPSGGFQAADPSTIAEQYLTSTQPSEVRAHDATRVYGVIERMLAGG
jgi:hypothetical protein